MSGTDAIFPGDMHFGHELSALLGRAFAAEDITQVRRTTHKVLLEAATRYLRDAGIGMPCAGLSVQDNSVVMHGAPHCGEMLVCALEGNVIQNCL